MKNTFRIISIVFLALLCMSSYAQKTPNHPLPQQPDTLRILGIGNSFTDDGMMYLPDLLEAAGIHNVVLGRLYIGGCSLERHCNEYEKNSSAYKYYKSTDNKWVTVSEQASLVYGIEDEDWDIVVTQQSSPKSGSYDTFQPWLNRLMEIVRWHCGNAGACFAWQQTWAYAKNSDHNAFPRYEKDQMLMYNSIMSATKILLADTSIEIVIPTGTAVQNMRNTEFCDAQELTRDGYHLSFGAGRYLAACTWFQTLVAPCLKTTLAGNTCILEGKTRKDKDGKKENLQISPELAKACQEAARRACIRPLEVWK